MTRKARDMAVRVARVTTALAIAQAIGPACGLAQTADAHDGGVDAVALIVEIADPASGRARVRVEIPTTVSADRSVLTFTFPDLRRGHASLDSIRASGSLTREGDTFELKAGSEPLTLDYIIDPTFYPPGQPERVSDARSRITAEMAVVRTTSLFPRFRRLDAPATVVFRLPEDWKVVAPWPERDGSVYEAGAGWGSTVEYVGLGPFAVETLRESGSTFRVGTSPGGDELDPAEVIAIVRTELEILGAGPSGGGDLWSAVVVPRSFMRGGAAGRSSVVQPPDPGVLAHEIFHWWSNGATIAEDAVWFREGFTEYYGVKSARAAAAWTEAEADACLADLNAEMRFLERDGAMSLVDAARAYRSDSRARRLVYAKGALLALHLDRSLTQRGRSLDLVMSRALVPGDRQFGTRDLITLFDRLFHELTGVLETYLLQAKPLPDLHLSDATGLSGCARYLP
ncbi:MAG: hypothetical protein GWN99_01925 [Gemmatimonadetes bacterium]|nr:hypothetical protein [Gemmatimonadota bacterium]NIR99825.1 hypothetical protein [Gemmatimonadota bacterium]NIT65414.1 hypothetical protein [Gemmatimonadota bacterium]NIV22136.1 hypothetical protein [Gemmatimonadota bacterium]NIW35550.1 hypothetical protein [Gemmatimonadota bacterium]